MIDPKELYIGSHVMVDGVRAKVTDIESNYDWSGDTLIRFCAMIYGEKRTCGAFYQKDGVEPIPITPELLTELGFECIAKYSESWWQRGNKRIKMRGNYVDVEIYQGFYDATWQCKYLHELEAFVYLTTKTELIKE